MVSVDGANNLQRVSLLSAARNALPGECRDIVHLCYQLVIYVDKDKAMGVPQFLNKIKHLISIS